MQVVGRLSCQLWVWRHDALGARWRGKGRYSGQLSTADYFVVVIQSPGGADWAMGGQRARDAPVAFGTMQTGRGHTQTQTGWTQACLRLPRCSRAIPAGRWRVQHVTCGVLLLPSACAYTVVLPYLPAARACPVGRLRHRCSSCNCSACSFGHARRAICNARRSATRADEASMITSCDGRTSIQDSPDRPATSTGLDRLPNRLFLNGVGAGQPVGFVHAPGPWLIHAAAARTFPSRLGRSVRPAFSTEGSCRLVWNRRLIAQSRLRRPFLAQLLTDTGALVAPSSTLALPDPPTAARQGERSQTSTAREAWPGLPVPHWGVRLHHSH